MNTRTKLQHYVPRFYLERFANSDGNVWVGDFEQGSYRFDKPSKIGAEKNIYTPNKKGGGRHEDLEELFAHIEGHAAPLFDKLEAGEIFEGEERQIIADYLAAQYVRPPTYLDMIANVQGDFIAQMTIMRAQHKEAFHSNWRDYERKTGQTPSDDEEIESQRQFILNTDNYEVNVSRMMGLLAIKQLPIYSRFMIQMKWQVARIEGQHLITSDHPVSFVTKPRPDEFFWGQTMADKTAQVSLPLSPTVILELSWEGEEQGKVHTIPAKWGKEQGKLYNKQRAYNAQRFLFSDRQDQGIISLGKKWVRPDNGPKIQTSGLSPDRPKVKTVRTIK